VSGKLKLYGFTGSNSVYTGRLMLEHKGLDYDFVKLPPAVHAPTMLLLGFPTMGVPAIKVGDVRVQGTRWIARALDELYPDKPLLFPTDPAQRRKVQQAERWGEELQNAVRRIFYCAARRDRKAFLSVLGSGRGPVKSLGIRMLAPVVIKLATGLHRASDEAGREDIELMPERLDQIDAWIADGVLGGEQLNAADYQIAVNVAALMLSEDLTPYIDWRPAAALARRVLPEYGGHIGPVVPAEWMEQLHATAGDGGALDSGPPAANGSPPLAPGSDAVRFATITRPHR
jgi:glutathione S-transferase